MNERKALGKGLSALISSDAALLLEQDDGSRGQMLYVSVKDIETNPYQPRKSIDQNELSELSQSIKEHGILQPLLITKGVDKKYCLIAGERRWLASMMANIGVVPAIFKACSNLTLLQIAILENIQRQDLTSIEEAKAYQQLIEQFGYTQEMLAEKLGKSRSHISNMLRILKLPDEVQGLLESNQLSVGHAKAISTSDEPVKFARKVLEEKLTVRDTERLARSQKNEIISEESKESEDDVDLLSIEKKMSENLGCAASIKIDGSSGTVTLSFKTLEEFDILVYALCRKMSDVA